MTRDFNKKIRAMDYFHKKENMNQNNIKSKYGKGGAGFTLLETVIAIGILGLVIVLSSEFINSGYRLFFINRDQAATLDQMRATLEKTAKEIRLAQNGDNGAYPIEQATASSLTIYTNADGDSNREKIRYFLDGIMLKRGVIKPVGSPVPQYLPQNETISTLATNIRNTDIFSYYDKNYDGTTAALTFPVDTSRVRLIHLKFVVDVDPNKLPAAQSAETSVSFRNLKDNL